MLLLMLPEGAFETRPPKKVFTVSVFYDSTYPHASDLATYSSEIVNRQLGDLSSFELAVNLHRVGYTDAYRLARLCTHEPPGNSSPTSFSCPRFAFPQVCSDISQGRIAIIAIGISPSFRLISAIAANLVSPFPQGPFKPSWLNLVLSSPRTFLTSLLAPTSTTAHRLDPRAPQPTPAQPRTSTSCCTCTRPSRSS
jgi:hypothetical protein